MLGQSMPMLDSGGDRFPSKRRFRAGATATDLVLTVTQMLRKKGVVNKFVEFFGEGISNLERRRPRYDRQHVAGVWRYDRIFPVDDQTLAYLRLTGRSAEQVRLIETYCKAQGIFRSADSPEPVYTDILELDLGEVEPSLAGPRRPQDRVTLGSAKREFRHELAKEAVDSHNGTDPKVIQRWVAEGGSKDVAPHEAVAGADLGPLACAIRQNGWGEFPAPSRVIGDRRNHELH